MSAFLPPYKFKNKAIQRCLWALIVFHTLFLNIGCGNVDKDKNTKVFRYNEDVSVTTLDPAYIKSQSEIWIVSQLYNGLVQLDKDLKPVPSLAKSWEVSNESRTYTFHLRNDVLFHNDGGLNGGKRHKLCAKDFVHSFYRILNPANASPGAWIFNDKVKRPENFTHLQGEKEPAFEALNDSTFRVNLVKPFPPLLSLLAMPYCYATPHTIENTETLRLQPIGTGAFRFKLWEDGVKMILLKNETYFNKDKIHIDAVNIDFIQNKQLAFMNFIQGKYDFFNGIDGSFKDELLTPDGALNDKYKAAFQLETRPFLNTEYLGIILDTDKNPMLNEKLVRQALNYSIDKEKMISTLRNGMGTPAKGGFIPVGLSGNIYGSGYKFDIDKAKELLAKANYKKETVTINTTQDYLDMCLFIKSQWSKLGIKTRINIHPAGFLRQLRNKREIKVYRGSWIADYADAENYLSCFYSNNFSPDGPNYCHFKNNTYDSLYREVVTKERTDKVELYQEMDKILVEEAPIIFLYYDFSIRLLSNKVKGMYNSPSNTLNLEGVRIED